MFASILLVVSGAPLATAKALPPVDIRFGAEEKEPASDSPGAVAAWTCVGVTLPPEIKA